jgi:hypothetical protein
MLYREERSTSSSSTLAKTGVYMLHPPRQLRFQWVVKDSHINTTAAD